MELQNGSRSGGSSPPPRYSTTEDRADDANSESDEWSTAEGFNIPQARRYQHQADLPLRLSTFIGVSWTIGLYLAYPAPTTVPLFIGSAFVLVAWTVLSWLRLLTDLAQRKYSIAAVKARYPLRSRLYLGLASILLLWWALITLFAIEEPVPQIPAGGQYFIAINLHNNEAILHNFIEQMTLLIFHREC